MSNIDPKARTWAEIDLSLIHISGERGSRIPNKSTMQRMVFLRFWSGNRY